MALKNQINTYADLTAYNADNSKEYPNISYIIATDEVLYGSGLIVAKFNINTTGVTRIFGQGKEDLFDKVWIDGVEPQYISSTYEFDTTGEHTVKYSLVDKSTVGKMAFDSAVRMTSIKLPNGITSIGDIAFGSCIGLTSVTIPNSVTSIGAAAFNSCTGLTSITIPSGVTTIGIGAFENCTGLTSVTIGSGVTTIGIGAFNNCTGLTTVTLHCNEYLSQNVYVSSNVKGNFGTQVTTYIIGDSVTNIGNNMFNGCSNVTSITLGKNLTTIGENAFKDCTGLTSLIISDNVTQIQAGAFNNCGLTTLTLGTGVQSLYRNAFRNNPNLINITSLNINPPVFENYSISYPVFDLSITGRSIYVPSSNVTVYQITQGWSDYASDIQAIPTT